ncbi:type II toxin-antitoxin system VapC family toxin [Polaromonas sp.]|uniref:type II toxin-antitoxin system VapC family toxin n=1 Tax=Polaromonas sp. TaxID=1869339 RepID=UPI0017CCB2E6|nr:type II toxin-antitoxin system VapC family toxin [Polaromonas sp.]NMM06707.1 type II toxin-antitoxin system VapC family toxin [Polaromonas sp.]
MSGIKYLLDTNCILGLLKATPEVLEMVSQRALLASECAYSAITRMELLGYPGINAAEEQLIVDRLSKFTYRTITIEIEDGAIALRRAHKVKLPDAIIAATAIHDGLELLTFDIALLSIVRSVSGSGA